MIIASPLDYEEEAPAFASLYIIWNQPVGRFGEVRCPHSDFDIAGRLSRPLT